MTVFPSICAIPHVLELSEFWGMLAIILVVFVLLRFFVRINRKIEAEKTQIARMEAQENLRMNEELTALQKLTAETHSVAGIEDASLFLEDEEEHLCHKSDNVVLFEPKPVRLGGGAGASVHVAKGVTLHSGGGAAVSVDTWQRKSVGILYVTNKRIIYDGDMENRSIPFDHILSLRTSFKKLDVSLTKGRKKTIRFFGCNGPLIEWLVHEFATGHLSVRQPTRNEIEGETICPVCHTLLSLTSSHEGFVSCPNCKQVFSIEIDEDC